MILTPIEVENVVGGGIGDVARVVPEIADEVRAIWEVFRRSIIDDLCIELHVRGEIYDVIVPEVEVVGIANNVKGMLTSLIILAIPYDTEILKHPVLPVYLEVFDV